MYEITIDFCFVTFVTFVTISSFYQRYHLTSWLGLEPRFDTKTVSETIPMVYSNFKLFFYAKQITIPFF
jgi:hypothetical protein